MDVDSVKARIQERLNVLNMSANAASEAAGLDRDFVRTIMRGKSKEPSAERMLKLAKALCCRLEWLVTGDGPVTDEAAVLSQRDIAMLRLFRSLDSKQQEAFYKGASTLAQPEFLEDDRKKDENASGSSYDLGINQKRILYGLWITINDD